MKIKIKEKSYEEVLKMNPEKHSRPKKPNFWVRKLIQLLSKQDLKETNFTYQMIGMEKLGKNEPCLILMNHSSFIDLKIASTIFKKRKFNIVSTEDSFIGKKGLMKAIGCIPTKKFITDTVLVRDMMYCFNTLKTSILLFPEASYSFDGCASTLPLWFGKSIKLFKVPVVMVKTDGAFLRDPLYNNLQLRKVNVSAKVSYLLSKEEIINKSVEEINQIIKNEFSFDGFFSQRMNNQKIKEPFRADFLNRVIYKCPACKKEGQMNGKGITLSCNACKASYILNEDGLLEDENKNLLHIPTLYKEERESVKNEILNHQYQMNLEVDIYILKDYKALYKVGSGKLTHNEEGFTLVGLGGLLNYKQKVLYSYSAYCDYYWYEIGDVISIGDEHARYYCFPKNQKDVVTKVKLAQEELYKLASNRKKEE